MGLRLLENGGEDVADLRFLPLRALHVHDGGLEHAPERRRLFRLALLPARELFDRLVEVRAQVSAQQPEVRAAGGENALAVGIMGQRVEQMLECEIRVTTGDGFAERDVEDDFNGGGEHPYRLPQASSIVAFNGCPASLASEITLSALVSATSHG